VREVQRVEPETVERAVAALLARVPRAPDHVYVGLPTPAMPRLSVSTEGEGQAWFVNADGSLGDRVAHDWTHLLLNLHIYLHLPSTIGLVVVGASGALLFGLVVSGFLAHPRIFKDAFRLRAGGSRYMEQADIHNRLSVWGAPFHVVISLTGAYFGLASVIFVLLGAAFHGGKTDDATAVIYGPEPRLHAAPRALDVTTAFRRLADVAPAGTSPSFLTVHDPGTPKQYLAFEVVQPGRLIWAEYYRFDGAGTYLGRTDYSDGPIGRQVIYSSYRIHFGNFGGLPVKILYALLGLSLTVISATGINIWLARRRTRDSLNDLWMGTIWGAPAALALTAVTEVVLDVPSTALFWLGLGASIAWSLAVRHPQRARRDLCAVTAGLLGLLLVGYAARFGAGPLAPPAFWIGGGVLAVGVAMGSLALRRVPEEVGVADATAEAVG
jgi:uncharacterized iron-regulated membrane protein